MFVAPLLVPSVFLSVAVAAESEAESCLKTKVWDGYAEGWGVRTMTSATLPDGKTKNYLVTLYQGNEYKIRSCADENLTNLDLLLYDAKGSLVMRDETTDREPELSIRPQATGTYYIVLYARQAATPGAEGGAAMAVVYR
jgi:hypothetical protein